jgi:hypothetical protein
VAGGYGEPVLVAAAVCPHPPLLVPGVGAGASGELDGLRAACDAAVDDLVAAAPDVVVVVGGADALGPVADGAWGSLAPYGVRVPVGSGEGTPTLPLALTIGRWLLNRRSVALPTVLFGVEPDTATDRCLALGEALADRAGRVALLVMGDGSARRSLKGPGYLDPDAEPFDAAVESALAAADGASLAAIDLDRAVRLLAAGRAPWQVLAGAAQGGSWTGAVTWSGAPYGVTYLVATWRPSS